MWWTGLVAEPVAIDFCWQTGYNACMDDILTYIDRHLDETIARLQAFCRQPSIAAQGTGMAEMAELVRRTLEGAGASAELVPTGGYPVVLGRCTRMLYDLDCLDSESLAHAFRLAVSRGNDVALAAAWIEGLLLHGAMLLLHDDALFKVIDAWVGELEEEDFIRALPLIRRAFSTFSSQELGQLGDRVLYGSAETLTAASEFDPELAERALPLLRQMLGLA